MPTTDDIPAAADLDALDGALPRSFLRPVLHLVLASGPSHGYELLEDVRGFGVTSADLAGVYRTLRSMEREGTVSSQWEPSDAGPQRRVYELTTRGAAAATLYGTALRRTQARLERLLDATTRGGITP